MIDQGGPWPWRRGRSRPWLGAAAVVLFFGFPAAIGVLSDWLWFGETGYQQVLLQEWTTRAWLGSVVGLAAFAFLYAQLHLAIRGLAMPFIVVPSGRPETPPMTLGLPQLRGLAAVASGVVALLMALAAASQWQAWLLYRHAVPFGEADPILGRDLAFYVFALPWLDFARGLLLALLLAATSGCGGLYLVGGALRLGTGRLQSGLATGRARPHMSLLVAAVFLVLALGAYLDMPQLLLHPSGIVHGASYVGANARLPALWLLLVAALVSAALAALQAWQSRPWLLLAGGGLYLAVWVGGGLYAAVVQRLVVAPNEQANEAPYIAHNIAATRRAFGLERVEERSLSGDAALTRADIDRNSATLENVRLWDHQPLLDTFGQIQEIRTYYDFVSVDNDRYMIDGKLRQVMLSARELNARSLPNRTWINERLTFTHGHGLALGPVNQVSQEGLPVLWVKNLPPESSVDIPITEPSLYYSELSSDYVIVKTQVPEFHYPKGDDNVYSSYTGSGGIAISSWWRRLLFAVRFHSFDILVSPNITDQSRLMFRRQVAERVTAIAPFLTYDEDPYLVVSAGRLYWIQDAYTVSRSYPYSTPSATGISYIRNSVKAVVDAYDGTVSFFLADEHDPVAATLGRIYPGLFKPLDQMPQDLRGHLRYPESLFGIQAAMYLTYHMTNPSVFYNKEDQWEIPALDGEGRGRPMQPYYTIMKLPGEERAEFIQMLPFTPRGKDNLSAWMVARSDGDSYGKLLVFQFPKQKVVFGPRQVIGRINQDQLISPQITLWDQQGSEVIQGTLLVIPIEESLLYVRPLYLRAADGRIPELKRVIVAYQNQIVMEETLEAALGRIFGGLEGAPAVAVAVDGGATPPAPSPRKPGETPDLQQARVHFERALEAQRRGDWSAYGEELRRLGAILGTPAANPRP